MDTEKIQDLKRMMAEADIDGDDLKARYDAYSSIDDEQALNQLKQKVAAVSSSSETEDPFSPTESKVWRLPRLTRYAAAAAAAILIVGGLFWYRQYTAVTPPTLSEDALLAMQQSRESGRSVGISPQPYRPTVQTDQGSTTPDGRVSGSKASEETWIDEAVEMIQQPTHGDRPALSIDTREGKEYWLSLPDGSIVHLNNGTRVIYPEKFIGDTRDVILEGEAYFMVAKDRRHPFLVHTLAGDVKVYGTEFNISAHRQKTEIVLVKGSVSVTPSATSYERMLKPGQMATLSALSTLSVEDVDVEPYVAWNTGTFVFDNIPMQQLMDVLSKWYGFSTDFLNPEAKEKHFTGELDRYGSIKPTLDAISQVTGLSLRVSDGKIIIE